MKLKELKDANIFRFIDDLDKVHEITRLVIEDGCPFLSRYFCCNDGKQHPITKADLEREVMFLKERCFNGDNDYGMKLYDLKVGQLFQFVDSNKTSIYEYRGNGWYGSPEGYDGGPWHDVTNPDVRFARESYVVTHNYKNHIIVACIDYSLVGQECPTYIMHQNGYYKFNETVADISAYYTPNQGVLCAHKYLKIGCDQLPKNHNSLKLK